MTKYISISFIITLFFLIGCSNKENINFEEINIDQEFKRFEQDLFNIPIDSIWDYVPLMQKAYPRFFELYNKQIIEIGSSYNFNYDSKLSNFLSDPDIYNTFEVSQNLYEPLPFKQNLTQAFKRINFYFPEIVIPNIYTHISGFNQSIIVDSAYLSISLDKYLGVHSKYYKMLRTPQYLTQNMHPKKIPSDVMLAFLLTEFPNNSKKEDLISAMIYHGKIQYALEKILPHTPDSILWGYSERKLKWCSKNERQMWMYLIENKLVFSTSFKENIRYIEESPFTSSFSKKSPGKTGRWLGYRIVKSFMRQSSSTSLIELLNENDHHGILNESKYKP